MKFLKYNRAAAAIVLAAVILLAIPLGVNRSVASLARRVERIYESGSARYGTVKTDLEKASGYAGHVYAIYAAAHGADAAYERAAASFDESLASPFDAASRFNDLYRAASELYYALSLDESLPEAQRNSVTAYFYELTSTQMRLAANEEYAAAAARYNRAIGAFPASVLTFGSRATAVTFGA